MSIQLVIAEKPSVARSIAGVIGADKKQDGYRRETAICELVVSATWFLWPTPGPMTPA